jgi:hypothetical protein
MGVVDAAGAAIRGATWTMFGHTFAAGDAIVLPTTEDPSAALAGAYASGLPATLFTNTPSGSGNGTFEVLPDGSLAPAFIDVAGSAFGLRCGVSPFPPITTGTLEGTVLADGTPKANVSVLVADAAGGSTSLLTDGAGNYQLADVPQGAAVVTLGTPAGFHAVDPASGSRTVTIVAGETARADFSIAADTVPPPPPPPPPPLANSPEDWKFWSKEIRVALRGHGSHVETFKNMREGYPVRIFDEFANHATSPVRVQGVTQIDADGPGPKLPRRLELTDMDATIDPGNSSALQVAKRELLVILLNVVSGRLSLALPVNGTTLEVEIRRLADAINDGKPLNDRLAADHGRRINAGHAGGPARSGGYLADDPSGTALVPAETASAAAARVSVLRDGSRVRVAFTLPAPGPATLDVYDAMGRHVDRLYAGDAPAGSTIVTWNRARSGRGIYFARLVTAEGPATAKFVAVN